MRLLLTVISLGFLSATLHAQEFNGTWRGKLTQNPGGCFPVYFIEMQVKVQGAKVTGTSYHFSDINNFVKENFEGIYDAKTKSFSINELGVLTFHVPPDCVPCIKNYSLEYSRAKDSQTLR